MGSENRIAIDHLPLQIRVIIQKAHYFEPAVHGVVDLVKQHGSILVRSVDQHIFTTALVSVEPEAEHLIGDPDSENECEQDVEVEHQKLEGHRKVHCAGQDQHKG